MKAFVKLPVLFTILLLSATSVSAQFKLNNGNTISNDVKKVINDYPSHFDNILGEVIIQNPQSTDYLCNFKVTGAEECTITRYTGKKNQISSWQALMLTTESFDEAKKKFKSLYSQLNNLALQSMHLKGEYESPVEEKKFTSVLFSFDPADASVKKLIVELILQAEQMDWKVKVLVYDRDRDDNEKGEVVE
jgi:hypothetical protein